MIGVMVVWDVFADGEAELSLNFVGIGKKMDGRLIFRPSEPFQGNRNRRVIRILHRGGKEETAGIVKIDANNLVHKTHDSI